MTKERIAPVVDGHDGATSKRRFSVRLSPTGMSGVAFGVVAGGALAGPVGALVGAALGGVAGEALETAIPSKSDRAVRSGARSFF